MCIKRERKRSAKSGSGVCVFTWSRHTRTLAAGCAPCARLFGRMCGICMCVRATRVRIARSSSASAVRADRDLRQESRTPTDYERWLTVTDNANERPEWRWSVRGVRRRRTAPQHTQLARRARGRDAQRSESACAGESHVARARARARTL